MLKTKTYYTDYVNHMIRFYLSTPGGLDLQKKKYTNASIDNWLAVQLVFRKTPEKDVEMLKNVFGYGHYLPKAVDKFSAETGTNPDEVWKVLCGINARIARVRGLV